MTTSNIDTETDDCHRPFIERTLDRWDQLERGWKATVIGLVLLSVRAIAVPPL